MAESIKNIKSKENLLKELHTILLDESRLDRFQENLYLEEEFFVVIQLFVKIPFVQLELGVEEYQTLESKIIESLQEKNLMQREEKIFEYINNNDSKEYALLKDKALDVNESDFLNDFFEYFEVNR